MRDCNKRISVIVGKEEHEEWKDFAEEVTHSSVSQLVRWSVEQAIRRERGDNPGAEVNLEGITEYLEELQNRLENVEGEIKELHRIAKSGNGENQRREKIEEDVLGLLRETGNAMTIPQIADNLPHASEEVKKAIGELEDKHLLNRITPEESVHQDGVPRWKAL
ncbi:hypothetical protein AKJ51_04645 [candidate division MSBL1 archaeon SCGC-AAA382A20]|uniref:Uncharacterized protein n=1 Tax=candidate division MSBL1 archaeon SCGC-AAA382A20 TaxID=1698280 RepID=A0A133VHE5_9EURY|nr:hypothetical protein AKJ51_04645 [candidate division MSBL1 archaeon SCGC-AAA382A20]